MSETIDVSGLPDRYVRQLEELVEFFRCEVERLEGLRAADDAKTQQLLRIAEGVTK